MRGRMHSFGAAVGLHALLFAGLMRLELPPRPPPTITVEPVVIAPPEPTPVPVPVPVPDPRPPPVATRHRRTQSAGMPSRARAASPVAQVASIASQAAPPRRIAPELPPAPDSDAALLLGAIARAGRNDSGIDGGLGNGDGESPGAARGSSFLRGGARGVAAPAHESRAEPAQPVEDYTRLTPRYSDEAIDNDVSASVALRVEIDEDGRVVDASVLKGAGHGLDEVALETVRGYRFRPARDDEGRPVRAVFGWRMVWESHWKRLVTTTVAGSPNCRDEGPLNLGEIHPVYIDCDGPAGYFELAPEERARP